MAKNKFFVNKCDSEFNKEKVYDKIVSKLERENKGIFYHKNVFINFAFLFLVFFGFWGILNNSFSSLDIKINEVSAFIENELYVEDDRAGLARFNINESENICLNIPSDFSLDNSFDIYGSSLERRLYYSSPSKKIIVRYSSFPLEYKYIFKMDSKTSISTIEKSQYVIYKFEDMFYVTFKCDNYYYHVITLGLEEDEMIDLIDYA